MHGWEPTTMNSHKTNDDTTKHFTRRRDNRTLNTGDLILGGWGVRAPLERQLLGGGVEGEGDKGAGRQEKHQ